MIRILPFRSMKAITTNLSWKVRPKWRKRSSSIEWSGSGIVVEKSSPKAWDASSNVTPCFLSFSRPFWRSHSKSTSTLHANWDRGMPRGSQASKRPCSIVPQVLNPGHCIWGSLMNKAQQRRFDSLYKQHLSALSRQGKSSPPLGLARRRVSSSTGCGSSASRRVRLMSVWYPIPCASASRR